MIVIEIRCDGCGKVGTWSPCSDSEVLREKLVTLGWKCTDEKECRGDLCPTCASKIKLPIVKQQK